MTSPWIAVARAAARGTTALLTRTAAFTLSALLVAACGGGVDSGGTGAPAFTYASGPITGFGSVIVNGIRFDDTAAVVSDADGTPRSRDDLRLGMTVTVRGLGLRTDSDGNDASTAQRIVYASAIVGPLEANDTAVRHLTVLGQTVEVGATTAFEATLVGGQAGLSIGQPLAVFAFHDLATGRYVATRVERRPGVLYSLSGVVSGLDAATRSFFVGPTRITYGGMAAADVPNSLANGRRLRVVLAPAPAGPPWNALRIVDDALPLPDVGEAKVKGLVSTFTSLTAFSVDGTSVDARSAQFPTGSTGLGLGSRVEVRGPVVGGVLLATRVTLVSDGAEAGQSFETRGTITSLDTTARTFVVRDVTVGYAGAVDFRNGTAADLAAGRNVEARGTLSADGTRLVATRITFRD